MVDLVDVLLNVGGWLTAATVTILGIFLLHLWEQWSRERREVYSPLHEEVSRFLEGDVIRSMTTSSRGPPHFNIEFEALARSGLLHLKRHRFLREDVYAFRRLREEADRIAKTLRDGAIEIVEGLYAQAGLHGSDERLWRSLKEGDREAWKERFNQFSPDKREALLSPARTPDDLYDAVREETDDARKGHLAKTKELLDHAAVMQDRLRKAMSSFRGRYRRP